MRITAFGDLLKVYEEVDGGFGGCVIGTNAPGAGRTREELLDNLEKNVEQELLERVGTANIGQTHPTLEDLAKAVREAIRLNVVGQNTNLHFRLPQPEGLELLDLTRYSGILSFSPADQVIDVLAGTPLDAVQCRLALEGQCLPMVEWYDGYSPLNLGRGTIGGSVAMNFPHSLEAECGTWRDWVLGMTVVLANGTMVKSGSHAVKNVAGYDLHKLMIGGRGTLGVIGSVVLRTFPIASLPVQIENLRESGTGCRHLSCEAQIFQRVVPTDFESAWRESADYIASCWPATHTMWGWLPPEESPKRYPGDWVFRSHCGPKNLEITDPTQLALMKRAKEIFDPTHKLNPGEMGIF